MSTRVVIIVGLVIVLLLVSGVVAFTVLNKPSPIPQAEVTSQTEQPSPSPASTKGTIQGLLSAGRNTTCTIKYPDQSSQGTVFVSGTKFRGDFVSTAADKQILSHMIQVDGFAYLWTEGSKTGTKMNLDAAKNLATASASQQNGQQPAQTADLNKEVDTNCSDWTVDSSKFTVPADVKFTDLTQMLKNIPTKAGSTAPKTDTSLCNAIKDPTAKASCIKAVSGNQ